MPKKSFDPLRFLAELFSDKPDMTPRQRREKDEELIEEFELMEEDD